MADDESGNQAVRNADAARNPARSPVLRLSAGAAIFWERFWPMAVPPLCVFLVFLSASWLGLWHMLPSIPRLLLACAFAGIFIYAAWGLRRLKLPSGADITRRIEIASNLENRPVTAQEDELAFGGGDGLARALWEEHRKRMAAGLSNLTGGAPAADANRTDPWALRAFIAAIAFAAFGYSLGPGGGRIADAFSPPVDKEQLLSRFDAWINPPGYTRKPPVYLTGRQQNAGATIRVPQGSDLFLRFVGDTGITAQYRQGDTLLALEPSKGENAVQPQPASTAPASGANAGTTGELTARLQESGTLVLTARGEVLNEWPVEVIPDRAPTIKLTEKPSSALSGSLQLTYEVTDDYGVVAARGEIAPGEAADPAARPLVGPPELPLSLPRQRATKGTAKVNRDLTQHPWAGSEVAVTLTATDEAGQTGKSESYKMLLPGRNFSNPLALALLEQRRILALDANKQRRVADLLDASMSAPEEFITVPGVYVAMKVAYRRIVSARDDDALRSSLDLLWDIALAVEFGDLSQAERNLREAQERLSEALERNAPDDEIAKLMQELRQAMNELIEQMVREAMQNPSRQNPLDQNPMARTLRQRDLERMMDQIEDLARSGSKDAARQMLSELQRMMDNLRAGRMQQQQQGRNPANEALDKLSEMMRRQQELMDETFRMQQEQNRRNQLGEQGEQQQGQNGQPQQGEPGEQGQMTPEEFAEALKQLQQQQQQLQQELGELGKELEGLGLDPSKGFGEAGREMGEAGKNLGQGKPGDATGDQGEALQALRDGARQMMEQMAGQGQQPGQQQGEGEGQPGPDRNRSDPLGRNQQADGDDGLQDESENGVPDVIEAQRAREIMEAIRKRLERPEGPLIEKRYLERLLETE
jgi:uncharacterized protein (TIGR02302 family)